MVTFELAPTTLRVRGTTERFPVRRVYCVGRNYAEHSVEMGGDPSREAPFFFQKPRDAVLQPAPDGTLPYPPGTSRLEHEVELVVAIGAEGVPWAYGVGVDLTRRDLQAEAKRRSRPWDMAKGFDASAPLSVLVRAEEVGHPVSGRIQLAVDGALRQAGDLSDQVWTVDEVLRELAALVSVQPGDVLFMGTPAGVGPVEQGQIVSASIDGVGELVFRVGGVREARGSN